MISSSLLISLWALVGLPGQDMAAVRPPRPESANLWANPAVPSSEIPIPIEIEITDLVRLVEEHIPFGVLASETGNDGHSVRYAYTVSRDAPVTGAPKATSWYSGFRSGSTATAPIPSAAASGTTAAAGAPTRASTATVRPRWQSS